MHEKKPKCFSNRSVDKKQAKCPQENLVCVRIFYAQTVQITTAVKQNIYRTGCKRGITVLTANGCLGTWNKHL